MLLAIDPGTDQGWALFNQDALVSCGLGDPIADPSNFRIDPKRLVRFVIEVPRIYPGGRTANPQSIVSLAVKAGTNVGYAKFLGLPYTLVEPSKWKGQVAKTTQHALDRARLTAKEKRILAKGLKGLAFGKKHNVLDAVGIGLWASGRGNNATVVKL